MSMFHSHIVQSWECVSAYPKLAMYLILGLSSVVDMIARRRTSVPPINHVPNVPHVGCSVCLCFRRQSTGFLPLSLSPLSLSLSLSLSFIPLAHMSPCCQLCCKIPKHCACWWSFSRLFARAPTESIQHSSARQRCFASWLPSARPLVLLLALRARSRRARARMMRQRQQQGPTATVPAGRLGSSVLQPARRGRSQRSLPGPRSRNLWRSLRCLPTTAFAALSPRRGRPSSVPPFSRFNRSGGTQSRLGTRAWRSATASSKLVLI